MSPHLWLLAMSFVLYFFRSDIFSWSDFTFLLSLLLLSTTWPVLANCVDPDQLASEEAN